jgi:hypothetical protein
VTQVDATYGDAIESLRRCCCQWGFKASGRTLGHHQIWARDSMIASLGARFAQDNQIQQAIQASLSLLKDRRAAGGAIPNNVDCATLHPNFRAYADGGLWWIIASTLLAPDPGVVREALSWYEYQDVDQSGLLSMRKAPTGRISSEPEARVCTSIACTYWHCAGPRNFLSVMRVIVFVAGPPWPQSGSMHIFGIWATRILDGIFPTRSAPRALPFKIRWDARGRCRRSCT